MSEAITKAEECECGGVGSRRCLACRDDALRRATSGRAPDVEGSLRAEVARRPVERNYLAAERERLMSMAAQKRKAIPTPVLVLPPGVDGDIVALRVENARLTAERDAARADVASLDVLARGERAMVDTAQDVIADLRAKISECAAMGLELGRRLTERDAQLADRDAALAKTTEERDYFKGECADLHAQTLRMSKAIQAGDDEALLVESRKVGERLAAIATACAEVKRLTAREREAKWLFDSLPPFHFTPAFYERRDAWLAGCKS